MTRARAKDAAAEAATAADAEGAVCSPGGLDLVRQDLVCVISSTEGSSDGSSSSSEASEGGGGARRRCHSLTQGTRCGARAEPGSKPNEVRKSGSPTSTSSGSKLSVDAAPLSSTTPPGRDDSLAPRALAKPFNDKTERPAGGSCAPAAGKNAAG